MIKPLPGYVLISPIEEEQKTGAVYLPDTSKDKPSKGKIVAIGVNKEKIKYPEDFLVQSPVFVDQTVIYKKYTNQEVRDGDKEYLLVKFDELLAIVE